MERQDDVDPVLAGFDAKLAAIAETIAAFERERAKVQAHRDAWVNDAAPPTRTGPVTDGRKTSDFVRRALADGARLRTAELVERMHALGWSTSSKRPDMIARAAARDMDDVAKDVDGYHSLVTEGAPLG